MRNSCAGMLLLAAFALGGCASEKLAPSVYVHPNADFSLYKEVAVLPLENLTSERFAAERVRELLVVELSTQGLFAVIEPGEVNRVLRLRNIDTPSVLGPEEIKILGAELKAQALLTGTVIEYREQRSGTLNSPEVALSLRMIDVESGLVVWSVTDARTGLGVWTRLFGVGEENQTGAARKLIRDLLQNLE
jgi:polysaccharide biosynthesis protein PelC